jgi:hypothetical protein
MERNSALRFAGRTGDEIMPCYFFHLSFGQRIVPDEEGVELPNRIAARDEALAVVRDLANPEHRGNPRRWASWFLEVADETGRFFRTPIGHPALELVTPETNARRLNSLTCSRCGQPQSRPFPTSGLRSSFGSWPRAGK